jgi:hypothetical protein
MAIFQRKAEKPEVLNLILRDVLDAGGVRQQCLA